VVEVDADRGGRRRVEREEHRRAAEAAVARLSPVVRALDDEAALEQRPDQVRHRGAREARAARELGPARGSLHPQRVDDAQRIALPEELE
jgi:hypothetical protein